MDPIEVLQWLEDEDDAVASVQLNIALFLHQKKSANVVAQPLDNKKSTETALKDMKNFTTTISPRIQLIQKISSAGVSGRKDLFSSELLKMFVKMTTNFFKREMLQNVLDFLCYRRLQLPSG